MVVIRLFVIASPVIPRNRNAQYPDAKVFQGCLAPSVSGSYVYLKSVGPYRSVSSNFVWESMAEITGGEGPHVATSFLDFPRRDPALPYRDRHG